MNGFFGLLSARLALGWLIGGEWRAHPARLAMTAIAIAIGVALGFAVHLVNGSALSSFEGALRTVNGAADVQISATSPLGFDERLYPRIATARGVVDASPVVKLDARVGDTRFTLLGLDVIRAAQVTPSLIGIATAGVDRGSDAAFDGDALFLSPAAMRTLATRPGATLTVTANGRSRPLRVAGSLPAIGDTQAIGVIDIATAQWRFDRLGRLDRIDVKRTEAASDAALSALLPPQAVVGTAASDGARSDALSRAYRVNLDMLALVALLTGGFLVFSAQSLSVARRLRAFALIRTLGLPRSGIVATVAVEGLVIGVIGSALGLAIGYALAWLALDRFGGDLGAGYFADGGVRLAFAPVAAAGLIAVTVASGVGDYRAGDAIWCETLAADRFATALHRDVLVPLPAGRFVFGRLIEIAGDGTLGVLPPTVGARTQVIANPPWIARGVRLVRDL